MKKSSVLPKDVFPLQLKGFHDALAETAEKNLKSGFRKAGIVPLGVDQILRRLPTKTAEDKSLAGETCLNALSEMRSQSCVEPKQKCKKINVVSGKSVTNLDLAAPLAAEQAQEQDQNEPLDDEINTMIEDDEQEEQDQVSDEENLFEDFV